MQALLLFALLFSSVFSDAPCPLENPLCKRLPGRGFLELQNGQRILHLQGTPYERGLQHGSLLKKEIQENIDQSTSPIPGRIEEFTKNIPLLMSFVPEDFILEMEGLAEGSKVPLEKIIAFNLFPEMFHCSGITVEEELYPARVLDYSTCKNLQSTAILQVVEPNGKIPFLNVSYAGFIGTIRGINLEKIAIGEIGGLDVGSWNGMPMPFLLREILENASSIDEVKAILQNTPRTCEYYSVFSDGKTRESIGVYATANQLQYFYAGPNHEPACDQYDLEWSLPELLRR
jgi:hypothetical protein